MGPKVASVGKGRSKKMITMETKLEIIKKFEEGTRIVSLAREYGRNQSTIGTIIKNKEAIKASKSSKGMTILASGRTPINDEMERLLLLWIKEKEIAGDTLTQSVISHKATAIFTDLVQAQRDDGDEGTSQEAPAKFKASHGWFDRFKKRAGIHSVVRHGEAASSDKKAADEFLKTFEELVSREGYVPQQVFNCDETGLFWKKMPRRTYITAEENKPPGHKPMKDRLNLALRELEVMQVTTIQEELNSSDSEQAGETEQTSSAEIREAIGWFENLARFIAQKHPEKLITSRLMDSVNDMCMGHFRNILRSRQKQASLHRYFSTRDASENINVKRESNEEEVL